MIRATWEILSRGAERSYQHHALIPRGVILFLTYRCTSRCTGCNIWQRPVDETEELDWEDWQPILDKLRSSGIESIELFGGDALLRKPLLLEMIRYCSSNGIRTYFPTNSSSLTVETVRSLVEAGLNTIYISFDEVDEIEGQIRGVKRHAQRVVQAIERVKQARGNSKTPQIEVITTVSSLNYRFLFDFAELSSAAGAETHEFRAITEFTTGSVQGSAVHGIVPEPYFMPTESTTHGFTSEEASELLDILASLWGHRQDFAPMGISVSNMQWLNEEHLQKLEYPDHDCLFCTTQMVLTPYGDAVPCPYFNEYRLGNLQHSSVSNVWGGEMHQQFCKMQQQGEIAICNRCSIKPYHRGIKDSIREIAWLARERFRRKVPPRKSPTGDGDRLPYRIVDD